MLSQCGQKAGEGTRLRAGRSTRRGNCVRQTIEPGDGHLFFPCNNRSASTFRSWGAVSCLACLTSYPRGPTVRRPTERVHFRRLSSARAELSRRERRRWLMAEYKLISADSHIVEPPDMYSSRIDPKIRVRAPKMERRKTESGREY